MKLTPNAVFESILAETSLPESDKERARAIAAKARGEETP